MFYTYSRFFFAIVAMFALPVISHATVGGSSTVYDFAYDNENEIVYFMRDTQSGAGCPPMPRMLDIVTQEESAVFGLCTKLLYGGELDYPELKQKGEDFIKGFDPVPRIHLQNNDFDVELSLPDTYIVNAGYNTLPIEAVVFWNEKEIGRTIYQTCDFGEDLYFDGFYVQGQSLLLLRIGGIGSCFEGGYITEIVFSIEDVTIQDTTAQSKRQYSGERDILPTEGSIQKTTPTIGESRPEYLYRMGTKAFEDGVYKAASNYFNGAIYGPPYYFSDTDEDPYEGIREDALYKAIVAGVKTGDEREASNALYDLEILFRLSKGEGKACSLQTKIVQDPDFDSVRDDPRFKAFMEKDLMCSKDKSSQEQENGTAVTKESTVTDLEAAYEEAKMAMRSGQPDNAVLSLTTLFSNAKKSNELEAYKAKVAVDSIFDPLRDSPRYRALMGIKEEGEQAYPLPSGEDPFRKIDSGDTEGRGFLEESILLAIIVVLLGGGAILVRRFL